MLERPFSGNFHFRYQLGLWVYSNFILCISGVNLILINVFSDIMLHKNAIKVYMCYKIDIFSFKPSESFNSSCIISPHSRREIRDLIYVILT